MPHAPGRKVTVLPIGIALVAVVYVLYAWDRIVVPVELVEIRAAYGLSQSEAGMFASVFTFGLALTAIAAGLLVVRFGIRAILVIGALLFSACTGYISIGFNLADLMLARVGAGVGEGLYNVAVYSFLGNLTERHRGAAAGAAGSLFGVGLFLGPPAVTWLQARTGDWRGPFLILAAVGILGGLAIGAVLRGLPRAGTTDLPASPIMPRLLSLATRRNIVAAIVVGVNGVGVYAFISVYETYLRTVQHLSHPDASLVFSAFGFGQIIGGLPAGLLADRIGRRPFLIGAALCNAMLGALAFSMDAGIAPAIVVCLFVGASMNGIYVNGYATVQDQVSKADIPLGTGVLATVYFLTASPSGWLLFQATDAFGWKLGSVLVYTVPYLVAVALLVLTPGLGRAVTRMERKGASLPPSPVSATADPHFGQP